MLSDFSTNVRMRLILPEGTMTSAANIFDIGIFDLTYFHTSTLSRLLHFALFFVCLFVCFLLTASAMKPISPYMTKASRNTMVFNTFYL